MIKKFRVFESRNRIEELLGELVFKFDELRTTGFSRYGIIDHIIQKFDLNWYNSLKTKDSPKLEYGDYIYYDGFVNPKVIKNIESTYQGIKFKRMNITPKSNFNYTFEDTEGYHRRREVNIPISMLKNCWESFQMYKIDFTNYFNYKKFDF